MPSSTTATPPRDAKRVPMACINCRQKKLKVHYLITLLYVLRFDCTRSQCREPDEIQRECPRCIEHGIPCEYVPVNPPPTTPNAPNPPHHNSPPVSQPPHQGPQSFPPPGYYTTQPINTQWNPNIDPSLMNPQGTVSNPPATGGYPLGQSSVYPPGPPLNPSAHPPNPIFPPQNHGHQGPYLPNPTPLGDQSRQYGDFQATSHMGRVPYPTQYGQTQTGVVWSNVPANYYRHSGDMRPSGDQQ